MASSDFLKSAIDGADKITDILNFGRIIFYPPAGFCALLPVAMTLRMLAHPATSTYWSQFLSDLIVCSKSVPVWIASFVFGFIIANIGFVTVIDQFPALPPPKQPADRFSYDFSYPRLFSGGVHPKEGTPKDYAAWLIAEYYRYVEIAVYIPLGIVLSLPVFSAYSFVYLVRTSGQGEPFVWNAGHFAFAFWALGWVLAWAWIWPDFWVPRIAKPLFQGWVLSRRSAIEGLEDFVNDPKLSPQGGTQSSEKKQ